MGLPREAQRGRQRWWVEMKNHNGDGSQTPEPTHRYQWEGWAEGEGRGSPLCQAAVLGTFCAWLKNLPTLQGWSQDPY